MVKVLGELEALVIKCEDCLKEGQHLKDHNAGEDRERVSFQFQHIQRVKEEHCGPAVLFTLEKDACKAVAHNDITSAPCDIFYIVLYYYSFKDKPRQR